ncbi:MAG: Nif3-like dinuclear metal center hexameric protein [Desulfovibrionaceae bacterium]|nr:Nif3-like dinuclear metal center hexameric protein [Desulfovibrionaceae bacterium]MBF0513106.1 Nif3-like dinuclear metal center hexameric protein [Desulfovibrionaceae bacterium]
MLISGVIAAVERIAPLAFQADWDTSGIQIAATRSEIGKVALALDPTPENIARAVDAGADVLITHHPLLLAPRLPSRLDAYHRALSLALKADLWLYAAHTSLDVQPGGPAGWLAEELALTNRRVLEITAKADNGAELGFGLAGDLPRPLPFAQFCAALRRLAPGIAMRLAGPAPETVARVAYCPGSGAQLARAAQEAGADVFITGDVRYHAALEAAELNLCVIDAGHFSLEEEMIRRLAGVLAGQWTGGGPAVERIRSLDPFAALPAAQPGDCA